MLVPKAASYLDDLAVTWKDDVGLTRKVFAVETETKP